MANLSELLAQKADLEKQIEEAKRTQRADAIARITALMAEHGLTLADLGTRPKKARAKSAATSGKVAPKYRDAATGETWSGRGLQPRWLKAALASGKSLSDFAV